VTGLHVHRGTPDRKAIRTRPAHVLASSCQRRRGFRAAVGGQAAFARAIGRHRSSVGAGADLGLCLDVPSQGREVLVTTAVDSDS